MFRGIRRLCLLLLVTGLMVVFVPPASAASTTLISGLGYYDTARCQPVEGYGDYDPIRMTGDLDGCWYTKILSQDYQSLTGMYRESGEEIFFGSFAGGTTGSFTTTYKFWGKLDPITFAEIKGRCAHPIVEGGGADGLVGVSGRISFKDDVQPSGTTFPYRGKIRI